MTNSTVADARRYAEAGNLTEAIVAYRQVLESKVSKEVSMEANGFLGGQCYNTEKFEEAVKHFTRCTELYPEAFALHFDLGQTYEKLKDYLAAVKAYLRALHLHPNNGRYYLYAGYALSALGREEEALAAWSLGADIDPMVQQAQFHPKAGKDLKEKSTRADIALRRHFTDLHRTIVSSYVNADRVLTGIWAQTHSEEFSYKEDLQRPHFFYMPDLPAIPVFNDLDWAIDLASATPVIRDEYLSASSTLEGKPYIHPASSLGNEWNRLKGSTAWQSVHLYQDAKVDSQLKDLFPGTLKALKKVPLVLLDGTPLEVFFSVLAPGASIPPHFGLANSRMTVHLPIIVPTDCGIRVGTDTYEWQEGKVFAFDDSFEHEAWNRSNETRVVLIFEAWVPDLQEAERKAISASFSSRSAWLSARKIIKPEDVIN